MTIVKTPAIVLRISPFSRTSRMVTWLTPEYGRVVTAIKGACRPKSAFLGQYDLASRCELLFYRHERDGVHIARECAPLEMRPRLREDWRAALAAGYLCELAGRTSQPMLDASATFELLDHTLDCLHGGAMLARMVMWFELKFLEGLGWAPNLTPCGECGVDEARRECRFALGAGRLVCARTPAHRQAGASVAVGAPMLRLLREWQVCARPEELDGAGALDAQLALGIRRFLGMFIQSHLEVPPAPRQALFGWLDASGAVAQGERVCP
ncbi:MAG: DNA repair protein RecO [Kiritimatiellae bacterium]|nr:DNA repair protein RecO [Kiritimatiellia bacterium]